MTKYIGQEIDMDNEKVKTLIVDNNKFVCFAISEILKNTDFLDIVGSIHSTSGIVDVIKEQDIQLVLINIDLINNDKEKLVKRFKVRMQRPSLLV